LKDITLHPFYSVSVYVTERNRIITKVFKEISDCDELGRNMLQMINKIYKWHKHESNEQLSRWHYIMRDSLQTLI